MTQQGGQPVAGQWAEQQKKGAEKQQQQAASGSGDERTPDKTIGQVAYASGQGRQEGGTGKPQSSPLEPEKQGGIGGP